MAGEHRMKKENNLQWFRTQISTHEASFVLQQVVIAVGFGHLPELL